MAGITLSAAQAALQQHLDAQTAVLRNQAYEIAGRRLTRANLAEIQRGIEFWDARVKALSRSALGRSRAITPIPR